MLNYATTSTIQLLDVWVGELLPDGAGAGDFRACMNPSATLDRASAKHGLLVPVFAVTPNIGTLGGSS